MVKWLFFDIGSTIIDESDCDESRLQLLLTQPGAPERGEVEAFMAEVAAGNLHPYKEAVGHFSLVSAPWPGHLETLYPDAPEILERLSRKYQLGIIANQNPGTEQRLEDWGIRQYFQVIAASSEVGIA